jgi:hypothetical protein
MSMRGNQYVKFRAPADEHERIRELATAAGLNVSDYIRACLGTYRPESITPKIHRDTLTELGRIGNNLNQIAWNLNSSGSVVEEKIKQIQDDIHKIREAIK